MIRTFCLVAFLIAHVATAQTTAVQLLEKMHTRYKEGTCKNYTFSQRNTHYNNDTVIGESVWHESVGLPDKFRIVFGDSAKGNSVLFRNDSVFHYRRSELVKSSADSNTLLLLLGGMYYRSINDVKSRLKNAGYDLSVFSEQQWLGKPVFVIGAAKGDHSANQLWVDKKDLVIVRIIEKMNAKDMMDMRFESHQKWCKGFVENRVSFRRNGMLEQEEEYYNLKETLEFR